MTLYAASPRARLSTAARAVSMDVKIGTPRSAAESLARQQLTPEEYYELLREGGFEITAEEIHRIEVPIDGWYDISGFQDFIEGVMPGVPLDIARECLQKACKETWDEMELDTVPRNWMMVVASRA